MCAKPGFASAPSMLVVGNTFSSSANIMLSAGQILMLLHVSQLILLLPKCFMRLLSLWSSCALNLAQHCQHAAGICGPLCTARPKCSQFPAATMCAMLPMGPGHPCLSSSLQTHLILPTGYRAGHNTASWTYWQSLSCGNLVYAAQLTFCLPKQQINSHTQCWHQGDADCCDC